MMYFISSLAECLAAYRTRGILRWYFLTDAVVTLAILALWNFYPPAYDPAWRVVAVLLVLFRGAVTIERIQARIWPIYGLAGIAVHVWASRYPNVWPDSLLHPEIHAIAFCCMLFGLALVASGRRSENAPVAVLFLGTAVALYADPWDMRIRVYAMWFQSACYLWYAMRRPMLRG